MAEQVGWTSTRSGAVFMGFHQPTPPVRTTAVLLVPPFGWESVAAHRLLRAWARDLAADGYPAFRFQPPGSGDSEGTALDQDMESWSTALTDVVDVAREVAGVPRLTALALGHGGQVLLVAIDGGAAVDEAVLWAVPSRGRALLREMRAFATLSTESHEAPPNEVPEEPVQDDGAMWVHGYPLSARAQSQLTALDVTALSTGTLRRALVLGRGSLPPDPKLVAALDAAGVGVRHALGPGYDELTYEPRLAQPPVETHAVVRAWLDPETCAARPQPVPWTPFHETRHELAGTDAVLTPARGQPVATVLFIGAGSQPRSGPNRFWTDAARSWAERGLVSLRLDLHDIGDAPGHDVFPHGPEAFHDRSYGDQVLQVLDAAVLMGLPARFVLVGLSSGGFWAGQLAAEDDRVFGAIILNPGTLVPLPLLAAGSRRYLLSRQTWQRFLHDDYLRREAYARLRRSLSHLVRRTTAGTGQPPPRTSLQLLERLVAKGVRATVVLSADECATERLDRLAPNPFVAVHQIGGPSGAHTMSPSRLRRQAMALMERAADDLAEHVVRTGSSHAGDSPST